MIDYILAIQYNSVIALAAYWIPMSICLVGYLCKTWKEYHEEVARSIECQQRNIGYITNLTIGVVVSRIFATFLPGVNVVAIAFDIGWPMLCTIIRSITNVLDIPLVKPYKSTAKPK